MAACKSCNASIFWALSPSGVRMPVNVEPRRDGNLEIVGERYNEETGQRTPEVRMLADDEDTLPGFDRGPRYTSHFADCPDAASHRKGS